MQADERQAAIVRLEQLSDELAAISTRLGRDDEDQAAIVLESATRDVMAAAHILTRRQLAKGAPGGLSR